MRKLFKGKSMTRVYGGENTIHQTAWFDVETHRGKVVAVWFRCQPVPFKQASVTESRATDMESMYEGMPMPAVISIEVEDQ